LSDKMGWASSANSNVEKSWKPRISIFQRELYRLPLQIRSRQVRHWTLSKHKCLGKNVQKSQQRNSLILARIVRQIQLRIVHLMIGVAVALLWWSSELQQMKSEGAVSLDIRDETQAPTLKRGGRKVESQKQLRSKRSLCRQS
jgi:hypothetical protein